MELKCTVCGKEFAAKTIRAKYCCSRCKNIGSHNYKRTREEQKAAAERDKQRIIALYHAGKSTKEIIGEIHRHPDFIYSTLRESGLPKQLTTMQREVKRLREAGYCSAEIASALNKPCRSIIAVANRLGMPFSEEEKNRSIAIGAKNSKVKQYGSIKERTEKQIKYIADNHPGWKYISGWVASDGMMRLQCQTCGNVVSKSAITVRKNRNLVCPICQEKASQQNAILKIKARERKNREKERLADIKFFIREYTPATVRICKNCGDKYIGRGVFCSEDCRRKHTNRMHDRRITRVWKKDLTITLDKLYRRDKGTCWICGEKCDFDDCSVDINGNFIVGKRYPSVDHIYPLSKGGSHSWDNVALAHHYCNTLKRDKVVS